MLGFNQITFRFYHFKHCRREKKLKVLSQVYLYSKMSERERNNQNNNNSAYGDAKQKYQPRQMRRGDHISNIESSVHSDFRVLRCFCGCTALTYEEIEHFSMMNVSTLIVHPIGRSLFQNFLRIGHRHDKSEAVLHLECFEMCNKFLKNNNMLRDQAMIDDLLSLCPSYLWEEKIREKISNQESMCQVLNELKIECVQSIECHNDFDRFRRELLRKIGKS